ncbi:MAG: anti-sigma factor domain-containing protein, partial [Bryobacteraceae bacterium]
GRVLVSPTGGLVFVGSQLPVLPGDRTFELWLIPAKGAPQPAGLFRPNPSGESVHISPVAVDASNTSAVAVSIEPRQGSTAPTTKPILVVPLA